MFEYRAFLILIGFYNSYKAVFDAVKSAFQTKSGIKTVVLGEMVEAKVRGSIVPVISWLEPKD